jgi:hypothetical protein
MKYNSKKARLVYLLAASHSGSTLLAMLLGAHPEVATVGELKATSLGDPAKYRCSCKRLLVECPFWSRLKQEIASRGFPDFAITNARTSIFEVDSRYAARLLAPLYRGGPWEFIRDAALSLWPQWRGHLNQTQARNLALVQSVQSVTGAKVVIDSSKVALRLKYLLRIPELDLRVIRVIRDGRAVSMTYTNEWKYADASDPSLRGGGTGQKPAPIRENMADAANEWKRSNEASDAILSTLPRQHWTEVRYEELCADPAATLRRLAKFLDVDAASVNLNFRSREQHVIGNGMRMDSTSEIHLDERWKTDLNADDLLVFEQVAGPLNRKYGYPGAVAP